MKVDRRNFLAFCSTFVTCKAFNLSPGKLSSAYHSKDPAKVTRTVGEPSNALNFTPLRGPMPLIADDLSPANQVQKYSHYVVQDELLLPNGFVHDVIAAWGDPLGNSRFGYNNDYLSFIKDPHAKGLEGFLTINFEYISPATWMQTFQEVIGSKLPFEETIEGLRSFGKGFLDASALPKSDPLKQKIRQICREALIDQGIGIIKIRQTERTSGGRWVRESCPQERRITGLSGLEDGHFLSSTGPAQSIFKKRSGMGYIDGLGDRIIGTLANCAGGTTPWGTVLSAEENFQVQVPEPVFADGTSYPPSELSFSINSRVLYGQGNVFGLVGNKYGWIVEVDPSNPLDDGTKHTWLGRFRHEAVGIRVEADKQLAFYSGCDRSGGHLYKFVSSDRVRLRTDKRNSQLLKRGMLYAAQFKEDGTGRWLALAPSTPVDPTSPETLVGGALFLPQREAGKEAYFKAVKSAQVHAFKDRFRTLSDLYVGNDEERQGAILIDAHLAANAAGATCTARPEDTDIAADGSLYIAFTSGVSSDDGGPDKRIFCGPQGEESYEFGFVMRLREDHDDPAAMTFTWKMVALGGEPANGGAGFANPDNLMIDSGNNLWVVTDMATQNGAGHITDNDKVKSTLTEMGVFGNNAIFVMPTKGEFASKAYLLAIGPMECELSGPFLAPNEDTLFLSVQHPGELNGIRKERASEIRRFAMRTTDGQSFVQTREVPLGSNWPHQGAKSVAPRPAVVAIRRKDGKPLIHG